MSRSCSGNTVSQVRSSTSGVRRTMSLPCRLALFLLPGLWLTVSIARAQVQYFPERKVWVLQAGETTYAMGVNERGELQSLWAACGP